MIRPATAIREAFLPGDPLTLDEAAAVVGGDRRRASQALTHLAAVDAFVRVRKQLWVRAGAPADRYRLAARITEPYAFAYGTALALHGGGSADRSEVLVSAAHRFDSFEHDGLAYRRALPWRPTGLTRVPVGPEFVWLTSLARTVVECVRVPADAGGIAEVVRGVAAVAALDAAEVLAVVDDYGEATLAARLGFVLETTGHDDPGLLLALEERRPRARFYLEPTRRGGRRVPRWNVIVPSHLMDATTDAA
jgi:predicted transcriptional regulator of viral defense system